LQVEIEAAFQTGAIDDVAPQKAGKMNSQSGHGHGTRDQPAGWESCVADPRKRTALLERLIHDDAAIDGGLVQPATGLAVACHHFKGENRELSGLFVDSQFEPFYKEAL
jgi:hypothetical protein